MILRNALKCYQALTDLDWEIKYDTESGLKDSYMNDFHHKANASKLKMDFSTDDMVLNKMAPQLIK